MLTPAVYRTSSVLNVENLRVLNNLMTGSANAAEPHRNFPGDRPSSFILMDRLTPEGLGALISAELTQQLDTLRAAHIEHVIVLPLFPQFSATSTGPLYDQLGAWVRQQRNLPGLHVVRDYHVHPAYVTALAESIVMRLGETQAMTEQHKEAAGTYREFLGRFKESRWTRNAIFGSATHRIGADPLRINAAAFRSAGRSAAGAVYAAIKHFGSASDQIGRAHV